MACQVQMPAQVQPTPPAAAQFGTNCLGDPVSDEHMEGIRPTSTFCIRNEAGHLRRRRRRQTFKLDENAAAASIKKDQVRPIQLAIFHKVQTEIFD